jgi:hypothetical protein
LEEGIKDGDGWWRIAVSSYIHAIEEEQSDIATNEGEVKVVMLGGVYNRGSSRSFSPFTLIYFLRSSTRRGALVQKEMSTSASFAASTSTITTLTL